MDCDLLVHISIPTVLNLHSSDFYFEDLRIAFQKQHANYYSFVKVCTWLLKRTCSYLNLYRFAKPPIYWWILLIKQLLRVIFVSFCFLLLVFSFCHCTAFFWSNIKNSIHICMHFSCPLQCMKNAWKAVQKYVVIWLYWIDLLKVLLVSITVHQQTSALFCIYNSIYFVLQVW